MGYEWYDMVVLFLLVINPNQKTQWFLIVPSMLHHIGVQILAIPMNIEHGGEWYYAAIIFTLQISAAIAILGGAL